MPIATSRAPMKTDMVAFIVVAEVWNVVCKVGSAGR